MEEDGAPERDRALSPVVSVTLMVAITVVLAATIGAFVFSAGEENNGGPAKEPAPTISLEGELRAGAFGNPTELNIRHAGGDTVTVEDLEVKVSAQCGDSKQTKTARLTGLPVSKIAAEDYEGDKIFSGGFGGTGGVADTGGQFQAGNNLDLALTKGDCYVKDGNVATVTLIHVPSNSIIGRTTLQGFDDKF